jgi:hypothetical protein
MSVILVTLDIDPTISHWFAGRDRTDSRLGYTFCGIRFAWAEPRTGQRGARYKACWG